MLVRGKDSAGGSGGVVVGGQGVRRMKERAAERMVQEERAIGGGNSMEKWDCEGDEDSTGIGHKADGEIRERDKGGRRQFRERKPLGTVYGTGTKEGK